MKKLNIALLAFVVAGCSSTSSNRYSLSQDVAPTRTPTESEMVNPLPVYTPPSKGGNKPEYVVRGKTYQVLPDAIKFEQTGIASWYGRKFHGHLTSNGETYDMFAMTAAHKNLPLPTYVQVTNLDNGKTAIVRVNDRGPFHQGRIIDLSYSAAYKLGVTQTGTANVHIKAIATQAGGSVLVEQSVDKSRLESSATALAMLYQVPMQVLEQNGTFQLVAGPIAEEDRLLAIIEQFKSGGYPAKRLD